MTYKEASAYIQDAAKYKISLGLDSVRSLLHLLGDPQRELPFIHIAGTNGKGSVLAYLSAILTEAGYTTGSYSSPAVVEYREKIQVDHRMITEEEFADIMDRVASAAGQMVSDGEKHPTQFELETAAAILYFKEKNCDYVVLETGLGGRLDATNVVENVPVGILTSVSMDHKKFLGDTLEMIASEKAGIIKPGMDVVYLEQDVVVNEVFRKKAEEQGAALYPVRECEAEVNGESLQGQSFSFGRYRDLKIQMAGVVQPVNASLAVRASDILRERGAVIPAEAVYRGLESVQWPGRFQIVSEHPVIVADGAHNPDGVRRLAESIRRYFTHVAAENSQNGVLSERGPAEDLQSDCVTGSRIASIMGVFADKDYEAMVSIMGPLSGKMIAVTPPVKERALPAEKLCACMRQYCGDTDTAEDLEDALEKAREYAGENGIVVAFGSLSYMGSVLGLAKKQEEGSRK